eukprot:scaffold36071_cov32-Tisochrysis_lutea.AAC.2
MPRARHASSKTCFPSGVVSFLPKFRNLRRGNVEGPMFSQKEATPFGPMGFVASEKCSRRSHNENQADAKAPT